MASTSEDSDGMPQAPSELSRGSSVSTELQDEYQELIKYALVTPKWEPSIVQQSVNKQIPQLRLSEPDHRPLTTVDEYLADSESIADVADSAMGSDAPETGRTGPYGAVLINTSNGSKAPQPIPSPGRTPFRVPNLSPTESETTTVPTPPTSVAAYLRSTRQGNMSASLDPDMVSMANNLEQWSVKLKTMVLGELSKLKASLNHQYEQNKVAMKQQHEEEVSTLQDEIKHIKTLLQTYEVSVERKDQVISNLTRSIQTGRDRVDMARAFMHWKVRMIDEKRQTFTSHLARKHRQRVLELRAWQAWRSSIEAKWKERVEKACQNKAQEVCEKLSQDYEDKIARLNEDLQNCRKEVDQLKQNRANYEETMKKAFMRGVCALNLEAMSMFQQNENNDMSEIQNLAAAVDAMTCQPSKNPPASQTGANIARQPANVFRHEITNETNPVQTAPLPQQTHVFAQPTKVPITKSRSLISKQTNVPNMPKGPRKVRTKSPAEKFGPPPTSVLVERHLPNIQNHTTDKMLSHAAKYPHAPAQVIAGQQTIHEPPIRLVQ